MPSKHYIHNLGDGISLICLEVPHSSVVLLQGLFETYEGLGTVRTLDIKNSLLSVITDEHSLNECLQLLESVQGDISWRPAENVPEAALNFLKEL